jgi:hypothetical protein
MDEYGSAPEENFTAIPVQERLDHKVILVASGPTRTKKKRKSGYALHFFWSALFLIPTKTKTTLLYSLTHAKNTTTTT